MSNFQKVLAFNKSFKVPTFPSIQPDIWTKHPKLIKLRMELINEEVQELRDAVAAHDMTETIDALADILYVVYGMAASLGINADKAFNIVHESNMSKICSNEADAQETLRQYKEDSRYDSPMYEQIGPNQYLVKNASTGKVLKSYKYKPTNFESLF